jgi:hypothetical protein
LDFAAARLQVLPGLPRILPTDLLPGGPSLFRMSFQYPHVLRRHLFRRNHLCLQQRLATTVRCLSWDFQRSPLRCTLLKSPLPPRHRCRRFETSRTTARLCSASTVFHRLDGFRLFNPARLLHRAANHGVPGVLLISRPTPHQTVPPSEVFSPFLAVLSRYA